MKIIKHQAAESADITTLITTLNNDDALVRHYTRQALVRIGPAAVPALIEKLSDPSDQLRREATRVLSQINDSRAATALVVALEDDNPGVRWLASGGLISLGEAGLVSLLEALKQHPDSVRLREGAHHVLRILAKKGRYVEIVTPVLAALEDIEPAIELPLAAHSVLKMLTPVPTY